MKPHDFVTVSLAPRLRAATLGALLAMAGGCAQINWTYMYTEAVKEESRSEDRLQFVFFKSPWSPACTRFEEQVLKHPDVIARANAAVCIMLNSDIDIELAGKWGVSEVPGFVILGPDERVLVRRLGEISVADVLSAFDEAERKRANQTAWAL